MAGGNRYKHRSLGGGLVPNKQQAPQNNFYVAPTKRDYLAEALALAQAGLQGTAEAGLTGIGEALSNPTKSLAALLTPGSGALAVNDALAKPAADQLVKDWGGVKPAMQAGSDVMALADILSGKEKSVPFAPVYAGQKASDALVNAGTAALDASTFLPAGVARSKFDDVPSLSKFDEFATALDAKNAAAMADNSSMGVGSMAQMPRSGGPSFGRDPTRVARVQGTQDPTTLGMGFPFSGKDGEKPLLSALMDAVKGKGDAREIEKTIKAAGGSPEAFLQFYKEPGTLSDAIKLHGKEAVKKAADDYATATGNTYLDDWARRNSNEPLGSLGAYSGKSNPGGFVQDQNGQFYLNSNAGQIRGRFMPDQVKIDSSAVNEDDRGNGYGVQMYKRVAQEASAKNQPLVSDYRVTEDAARMYDALERRGYSVERNPSAVLKDGEWASQDGMPVFRVAPKTQAPVGFTPPTSLDDIFTGGGPRGPRELTGGSQNPAGMDGSAFNLNTPEVPYDPAKGFGGLDAKFAADKNARTLSEAVAKARAGQPIDPDTLSLLLAYGAASGMGSALWAQQAHQQQPGM